METERQEQPPAPQSNRTSPWILTWLAWVVATTAGWNTGWIAAMLLTALVEGLDLTIDQEFALEAGLVAGLAGFLACAAQWLVVGRRVSQPGRRLAGAGRWVLVHAAAWLLAGFVIAPVGAKILFDSSAGASWAFLAAAAALVGATQWLLVREQASKAWLWIAAGAVGWGLGPAVSLWGSYLAAGPEDPRGFLVCFGGGAVAGAITGAAAALCLRRPPVRPAKGKRAALLVGALWLVLLAASVTTFHGDWLRAQAAAQKLPDCLGEPDCPRLVMAGAKLASADLEGKALAGADLSNADLSDANLREADLSEANLSGANLAGANLYHVSLRAAGLDGAVLRGVDAWSADLSRADARGADLTGADLFQASLVGTDLREANLTNASLSRADLSGADLGGANLRDADLRGANLTGASLAGAELTRVDLTGTVVTPEQLAAAATLEGATMPDGSVHD